MELNFKVEKFQFDNGEECCTLADSDGMPLMYPTLYVMRKLRPKDQAGTIENKISALSVLFTWLEQEEINLEQRLSTLNYLTEDELINLRDFCDKDFSIKSTSSLSRISTSKVVSTSKPITKLKTIRIVDSPSVGNAYQAFRISEINKYVKWLAIYLANNSQQGASVQTRSDIRFMFEELKDLKPKVHNKNDEPKSLTEDQQDEIKKHMEVGSITNPYKGEGVQVRNKLIISLMYHLGIRSGEVSGIKIQDIDWGSSILTIHRRPDDIEDSRSSKSHQKTYARPLILNPALLKLLKTYFFQYRTKIKNSQNCSYLFISHHASKSKVGSPLSKSGVRKIFLKLRILSPLLADLSGHDLRHTWNDNFSLWLDSLPEDQKISPEEEDDLRKDLMGWSKKSKEPSRYNKRCFSS